MIETEVVRLLMAVAILSPSVFLALFLSVFSIIGSLGYLIGRLAESRWQRKYGR